MHCSPKAKSSRLVALVLAAIGALCAPSAMADVLYTDLSPGQGFFAGDGRTVSGTFAFGGGNQPAYSFVAGESGSVGSLLIGLNFTSGSASASLWAAGTGCGTGAYSGSCSGTVPLTELGQWEITANNFFGATVTGITGTALTAGTQYFLEINPDSPSTVAEWVDNTSGAQGLLWQCGGSTPDFSTCVGNTTVGTTTIGAFEIDSVSPTSAVPEPASLAMLMAGGALILRRRRH